MNLSKKSTASNDVPEKIQASRQTAEEWKRENREAMESWNDYVRKHGLPLEQYRKF